MGAAPWRHDLLIEYFASDQRSLRAARRAAYGGPGEAIGLAQTEVYEVALLSPLRRGEGKSGRLAARPAALTVRVCDV